MNQLEKTRLLGQIAAIPAMERGKLSPHSSGRHQKLQCWQEGRNHTRHVAADELPTVESALAGYAQYRPLAEQYADLVIQETRQNLAAAQKKHLSRPPSSSRRKKKSSN
jgi:predicted deacylase